MSIQYTGEEPLTGSYGVADSFPKDFGYGAEELEMDESSTTSDSKPRILLMGMRRSGTSFINKAADSKREQFRRYLEKAGVLDTLTKVLVELYEEPEKPNNALDFLKQHMGAAGPETPDVESLLMEVAELKQKYEAVLEENKELKAKLAQYETPSEEKHPE